MFSTANTESEIILKGFIDVSEGIIYPYPRQGENYEIFAQKYRERFSKEPLTPNGATTYDAVNTVIRMLKNNPENTEEMIDFMLETEFDGASNRISFDEFGIIKSKDFIVKTIRNGEFVPL